MEELLLKYGITEAYCEHSILGGEPWKTFGGYLFPGDGRFKRRFFIIDAGKIYQHQEEKSFLELDIVVDAEDGVYEMSSPIGRLITDKKQAAAKAAKIESAQKGWFMAFVRVDAWNLDLKNGPTDYSREAQALGLRQIAGTFGSRQTRTIVAMVESNAIEVSETPVMREAQELLRKNSQLNVGNSAIRPVFFGEYGACIERIFNTFEAVDAKFDHKNKTIYCRDNGNGKMGLFFGKNRQHLRQNELATGYRIIVR